VPAIPRDKNAKSVGSHEAGMGIQRQMLLEMRPFNPQSHQAHQANQSQELDHKPPEHWT
jgi:hypothetical protein